MSVNQPDPAAAPAGLSTAEAARRLAADGRNVLPERHRVGLVRRVLLQLRDPLILVLLVAAALTVATGDWTDATVITAVIVINTSVGVAQEVKADRAIAALSTMTAPEARVLRDGRQQQVPAANVVVGDVLVLADDDLATVVAATEEGRRVYANIRRFLLYGLAGGTAEILVMLIGPLVGLALPLLPAQILWINLLTHGLPGVALGSEPVDPAVMRRPPRAPAESVLGAGLWQRILRVGIAITAVTLASALVGAKHRQAVADDRVLRPRYHPAGRRARIPLTPWHVGQPRAASRCCRRIRTSTRRHLPPALRHLLGTQPLSGLDLLIVGAASTLGYAAIRLDRIIHPSKHPALVQPPRGDLT